MAVDVPLLATEGPALGRALAQVHVMAPDDAPLNVEQSVPLASREEKTLQRLDVLAMQGGPEGEQLDADAARAVWATARSLPEVPREDWVWSHADLHGGNVLSHSGLFGGIADWGSMAACDPAVDLGFAYTLMPAEGVAAMFAEYGALTGRVDDALVARARAIGLAKCVGVAMVERPVTRAMGWRGLEALGLVR
jgi:aminoglycoside phosphotransferase (APT) family kinase protein